MLRASCLFLLMIGTAVAEPGLSAPAGGRLMCSDVRDFDDVDVQVEWWASKAKVPSLVGRYEKASGVKPQQNEKLDGWTFRTETLSLSVMPAAQLPNFPPCLGKMAANELSIVWISRQVPARRP